MQPTISDQLRSQIYKFPDLDDEEKDKAAKWVNIMVSSHGRENAIAVMTRLLLDNMRLMKAINLHREELGYETLPVYELKI